MMTSAQAEEPRLTLAVMAKSTVMKNGITEPVGVTTTFKPSDRTIFCIFRLAKPMNGVARIVWTAISVETISNNTKLYEDKTKSLPNLQRGKFSIANNRDWPRGSFKVQIFLNNKLAKTLNFSVK